MRCHSAWKTYESQNYEITKYHVRINTLQRVILEIFERNLFHDVETAALDDVVFVVINGRIISRKYTRSNNLPKRGSCFFFAVHTQQWIFREKTSNCFRFDRERDTQWTWSDNLTKK